MRCYNAKVIKMRSGITALGKMAGDITDILLKERKGNE